MLNALPDGHALDLVDVNAVGLDPDLSLQLQPTLLEGCEADLGLDQTHLQLVDVLHQVLGLSMKMSFNIVNHQLHIGPDNQKKS